LLSGTDTEFIDGIDVDEDRGHGRTERRRLRVAPCDDTLFPGARQVFRLRRDTGRLDGVRTSKEIIHGIVSIDALDADIAAVEERIEELVAPFARAVAVLDDIPGVGIVAAHAVIAEIGVDMTRFPTAAHLAS
jgi:transposase